MAPNDLSDLDIPRSPREVTSHPWFEKLARFGFAAKGVVYSVVGLLAAQTALGSGGKTTGSSGALETIVNQPFGKFFLAIIGIGLIGYALWRFVQAVLDPEHKGRNSNSDIKRIIQRVGYGFSAIAYTGLAFTALQLVLGSGGGGNKNSTQDWTAKVLSQPFGQWLVGIGGVLVIGLGLSYIYRAYKAKFRRRFKLAQMSYSERKWLVRIGRFGIAARGTVFVIIGIFLIQAALKSDASEAKGLGGALSSLAQQPFGSWILGFVAFGLVSYGIFSILKARYRRFQH
ncbi:DUF1206 domain-containing protein [Mastigocoleus testarum]|uniref:DUF1206 domain-containing protein n=1 Tax=Mastigocoleus testarum BC008 TaxID=371196 RepID=A0A0V7ZYG9_9CYAN|nr:DUF1206 domain-containing protein [Mastigocoleus testarum]KST69560.1 hypothetical protein BC008_04470 [Mastigocoleus testarum BC008]